MGHALILQTSLELCVLLFCWLNATSKAQTAIELFCLLPPQGDRKGYKFWKSNPSKLFSANEMIDIFSRWVKDYPIVSIEDPLDQVHFATECMLVANANGAFALRIGVL